MAIFGGRYYSSKNAQSGEVLIFKDAGDWVNSQFTKDDGTPKKQFQITVDVGGSEYSMNLNSTSINNLIPAYGKDSTLWVGKQAKVEIVKAMIAGKMKDVVVLHPINIETDPQVEESWPEEQ